MREEGRICR
jgi:hypothetical protein